MARKAMGPATLEIVQAVRDRTPDRPLVAAVSGGADSLALAYAVLTVCAERGRSCAAVTVDHRLQAGSADRADQVCRQLTRLGYDDVVATAVQAGAQAGSSTGPGSPASPSGGPEVISSGGPQAIPSGGPEAISSGGPEAISSGGPEAISSGGPEARARTARYAVLDAEASRRSAGLVLGHTLDDQAETVMLGLARGSGTRSLAGMSSTPGRLRPLLAVRRERTRAACAELGLDYWDDPHNAEGRFTRSRIRHTVLPLLESELGPGVADALARTADLAAADADLLDRLAADLLAVAGRGPDLDCAVLLDADPALRGRAIKNWLTASGATETSYRHVRAVEALVTHWHGQSEIQVPGLAVRRSGGVLSAHSVQRSQGN